MAVRELQGRRGQAHYVLLAGRFRSVANVADAKLVPNVIRHTSPSLHSKLRADVCQGLPAGHSGPAPWVLARTVGSIEDMVDLPLDTRKNCR